MSDPAVAVRNSTGFGWIVPETEESRASARDPPFALSVSSVNHRQEIKPMANAASPAAIGPRRLEAKVPPSSPSTPYRSTPGTPPPKIHVAINAPNAGKVGLLGRPE